MNDDAIFEIYKFLPGKDIVICSLVSKQFYRVTKNEVLWKWNVKDVIKFDGSYYESYKFNYELERVKMNLKYKKSIKEMYIERKIYFGYNTIYNIPSQIGNLINLKTLDLVCNNVTSCPTEIGNLKNLNCLCLNSNKLTSIPVEIGNLKNLETLELSNNKLTSIPSELGNLKKLQTLLLCWNKLTYIPTELSNLENLICLFVIGNPLKHIPSKVYHITNIKF
jgi:hypothetical protein